MLDMRFVILFLRSRDDDGLSLRWAASAGLVADMIGSDVFRLGGVMGISRLERLLRCLIPSFTFIRIALWRARLTGEMVGDGRPEDESIIKSRLIESNCCSVTRSLLLPGEEGDSFRSAPGAESREPRRVLYLAWLCIPPVLVRLGAFPWCTLVGGMVDTSKDFVFLTVTDKNFFFETGVGTRFSSASPTAEDFVSMGDNVTAGRFVGLPTDDADSTDVVEQEEFEPGSGNCLSKVEESGVQGAAGVSTLFFLQIFFGASLVGVSTRLGNDIEDPADDPLSLASTNLGFAPLTGPFNRNFRGDDAIPVRKLLLPAKPASSFLRIVSSNADKSEPSLFPLVACIV